MSKYNNDERYNIKIKSIAHPCDKGFCKRCLNQKKENYCQSLDTACDKVYICRAYIYHHLILRKPKNEV